MIFIVMIKWKEKSWKKDWRMTCEDWQQLGFNTRGKTIKEVQELATSQNMPIRVEENDIVEGWVGKPKGIRQVLWERGLLDPQVTYVAKIKRDDPNLEEKVQYSIVLADCADFLSKKQVWWTWVSALVSRLIAQWSATLNLLAKVLNTLGA